MPKRLSWIEKLKEGSIISEIFSIVQVASLHTLALYSTFPRNKNAVSTQ
jgi:hypothetical protein